MILAAGLGTRLGSITHALPKALVDVAGRPALEHVARRLIDAGADRLIINVHHHADRIIEFVSSRDGFGVDVAFSREQDAPLETGGGLLHAASLFRGDAPFLLHNVDVLCAADLRIMYEAHQQADAVVTLAVHERPTRRRLAFRDGRLIGRAPVSGDGPGPGGVPTGGVPVAQSEEVHLAFAGIHVIAPRFLDMITERGAFSIMDVYERLASAGERIAPHDITGADWYEIGNPERLAAARAAFADVDHVPPPH